MNQELLYSLDKFEMVADGNYESGLIPVAQLDQSENLAPEEIIALENAERYGANFVYFRKFENRPSIPQVYLYDFTDNTGVEEIELTNLHQQLYSSGQVPMFFVFTKKDVRIFNCFERPAKGRELKYTPLTTIKLASNLSRELDAKSLEEFKAFSGKSFDNGTFWEHSKYSDRFKFSNSAYEKLLTELKQALKDIIDQEILPEDFARRILVISILIKYLEEREDENGNQVFPKGFFAQFVDGAEKFTDVLAQDGAFLELLDVLTKHFNGGIFELDEKERDFIEKGNLSRFGLFLDGEVDGMQFVFWRLYSFNDLPVELISNIYEEFLGKQPGVVYTPPYLVNFLLDESMPLSSDNTDFKILDPACGSGVFLVGAYRRLVHRWRKKNKWKNPDLKTLKSLLRENIFGVELSKEAVDLTIFSLSLALCDELTPLQIWKDLKFDDLRQNNIIHDDFFSVLVNDEFERHFDLIIGNPPFESKLTSSASNLEKERSKNRIISAPEPDKENQYPPVKLPDNQIALLFLEQSIRLCKEGGLVCLIQPSGPLLYNNTSLRFRQVLLTDYHVPQIIDFTHISRILFGKNGDVATAAIFLKNEKPNGRSLLHVTTRRTKPHKEKLFFELDTYDFHVVPYNLALNDTNIWKCNFIGGNRYHQLLNRLKEFSNLGDFLDKKMKENGWDAGEGYIIGNRTEIRELEHLSSLDSLTVGQKQKLVKLTKKYKKADFVTGKDTFDPKDFTTEGLAEGAIYSQKEKYFHYTGKRKIFEAPHVLIKELVEKDKIPTLYSNRYLTFKHRVVGIHAPKEEEYELKRLHSALKSKANLFLLASTSAEFMINRSSSFLRKDLNSFVLPNSEDDFDLDETENILIGDFLDYLLEFRRQGEKSKIAKQNASLEDISKFSKAFSQIISNTFGQLNSYDHFETDSHICLPFYFGDKPDIDFANSLNAEEHLQELVSKDFGVSLRLKRVIRLYEGNIIYLIKPKKMRYWLQSIAIRDADETFSDLRKQGY
ncbi:HsdM family class I SAM-dependent methyltransferase [Flagellimonas sp.]|uniref:HsdM family class I SAM-dependent methyltransferase n=1 Tax=Flagellimonas sp. TaxID=2058762 RepID=UPI003BABF4D3